MDALRGTWRVERVSGLLPPFGVGKRIGDPEGVTTLFGFPVARFTRAGSALRYRHLPITDLLQIDPEPGITGAGVVFGRVRFCRFRLVPAEPNR